LCYDYSATRESNSCTFVKNRADLRIDVGNLAFPHGADNNSW
jgi:hypothetical protein